MARLTDNFPVLDADDLLRPVPSNFKGEVEITWSDGQQSRFRFAVTFSSTAFNGERPWLNCPHCRTRCRKLYADGLNRVLWCRKCLGLRYRSQQYVSAKLRSTLHMMGVNPDERVPIENNPNKLSVGLTKGTIPGRIKGNRFREYICGEAVQKLYRSFYI